VPARDVHQAVGWIDNGLEDLLYDVEAGLHHDIEAGEPL